MKTMIRLTLGLTFLVVLADTMPVLADIFPGDRRTVWNPGIPGGVPQVTTVHTIIDAATYGDGVTDATSAINSAIQSAGGASGNGTSPQVVYLPPGNYRVSGTIQLNRSGVVLRGAGPALTRILSETNLGINLGIVWPTYGDVFNVLEDAPKGSTQLVVSTADAANIQIGDVLQIDQQDPPAVEVVAGETWMNGYVWLYNGIYHKRQPNTDTNGPGTGGIPSSGDPNDDARNTGPWRSVCQQVEVISRTPGASNTTLGLAGPLHIDFRVSQVPQLFHSGTARAGLPGIRYSGLEDFSFTGANMSAIYAWNLSYSWVKGIEVDGEVISGDPSHPGVGGPGISLNHAYRCVVRECYVHHSRRMVNNAGSYGIVLNQSSDCLIEDNISMWWCKPVVFNVSGGGNVVAYNYVDQAVIIGTDWQEGAIDMCHQSFSHSDLVEGNWSVNIGTDATHGNSGWMVYFRNYASGRNSFPYDIGEASPGLTRGNLRAAYADALTQESTFVGNVLNGVDAGGGLQYENTYDSHPWGVSAVYALGNFYWEETGTYDYGIAESLTYRHGNWDNVTGGVLWDPSNADHDLPDSLYLSSKPAFFGSHPWPWVDPLTGTTHVLPAKQRYDAIANPQPARPGGLRVR